MTACGILISNGRRHMGFGYAGKRDNDKLRNQTIHLSNRGMVYGCTYFILFFIELILF